MTKRTFAAFWANNGPEEDHAEFNNWFPMESEYFIDSYDDGLESFQIYFKFFRK